MRKQKLIFGFTYFLLGFIFYFGASYAINVAHKIGTPQGYAYIWVLNAVSFLFGILLGLPTLIKVILKKSEKTILYHRFVYIIPILALELWYNVPLYNFPYSSIFSNGYVSGLLFVLLGFSLITIVDVKDKNA